MKTGKDPHHVIITGISINEKCFETFLFCFKKCKQFTQYIYVCLAAHLLCCKKVGMQSEKVA